MASRFQRGQAPQMFLPPAPIAPSTGGMFSGPLQRPKRDFDWASLLQGVGVGLLTGKNVGEGLGQGLLYARQFGDQKRQDERYDSREAREEERYQAGVAKEAKAEQTAAERLAAFNQTIDSMNLPDDQKAFFRTMGPGSAGYGDLFPAAPKPTGDQQEYEQAVQQGFKGTLLDYQTALRRAGAGSNSTTIYNKDYGSIPPGHRLVEGPDGVRLEALPVEALPGSPAAAEAADKFNKEMAAKEQKQAVGDIVLDDIGRSLDLSRNAEGMPSTGFFGAILQGAPGTNAHNLQQTLQSIKANVSFDRLQAMRLASPTGGALGSVTENEGKKLESVYGALEQSQSQPQFEYNLKRLANEYMDVVHGPGNGPPRYDLTKKGGIGEGGAPDSDIVDELPPGNWQ